MSMSRIKIIDNFLNEESFKLLKNLMLNTSEFPWYYNSFVVSKEDQKDFFQFTHCFYRNLEPKSGQISAIYEIVNKLKPAALIRIKANLIPRAHKIIEHGLHTDVSPPYKNFKAAIYYLNTNNGYTKFEDGTKIDSVENRMVIFDGDINHTGTTCTDSNLRAVINFNYFADERFLETSEVEG